MTNIFSSYKQDENQFTNGLISILNIAKENESDLFESFLKSFFNIRELDSSYVFKVLENIKGSADAEISSENYYFLFETKIRSTSLRDDQIKKHLDDISTIIKKNKKLILLTPDDSNSQYIKKFINIDDKIILHTEWKRIYDFLEKNKEKVDVTFRTLTPQNLRE